MARFIRNVLAQNAPVTVSTVTVYNLGPNPISHVLYTLKFLNDTGTITNYSLMTAALASVSKLEILYKGQAILSGSLADIMMHSFLFGRHQPAWCNAVKTDNNARSLTICLPLGRCCFDPNECFPKTQWGQFQLQVTYAAAQTGIDTLIEQIEQIELPDASPMQFVKTTTLIATPAATGWYDLILPLGNKILGVTIYSGTVPTSTSYNASVGQLKLMCDNTEFDYSMANWESMHGELMIRRPYLWGNDHIHRGNFTSTVEGNTGPLMDSTEIVENYAFLDLDPNKDDMYAVDTNQFRQVKIRYNQIASADTSRFMPIELVQANFVS